MRKHKKSCKIIGRKTVIKRFLVHFAVYKSGNAHFLKLDISFYIKIHLNK